MIALLHYAWLKGTRDRSLPVLFFLIPAQISAMLIGYAVVTRQLQYPLRWIPGDQEDLAAMAIILPLFVASMSAFWTFRSEVATKAIGSFVLASRAMVVVVALVTFAAATAIGGMIAAIGAITLLTAAFPANFAPLVGVGLSCAVTGASLGALYVTISPQPAMLVWAFCTGIPILPWMFESANLAAVPLIGAVVSLACVAVSTFLLRRRCAT